MRSKQRQYNNVTIKDIAKEANVSLSTVSRVINNSAGVKEDKRQRVLQAIERTQYRPNLVARGLKRMSTQTIAMLVADGNNEYFGQLTKAIESVLRTENYNLFYCNTMSEQETEREYLRLMTERQVDGFIINSTGLNDDFIADISQEIPTILLHRRVNKPSFHGDFIDADFASISSELVDHLIELGHRDIGVICGPHYLSSHYERLVKIRQSLSNIGVIMDSDNPWYFEGPLTEKFGYESAASIFAMKKRPTALVITHSFTTLGALRYFKEHKIKIPEDLSFVSPCDVQQSDLLYVQPVCASVDAWSMGERCGRMLLERIQQKNDLINREVVYALQVAKGESTMPLTIKGDS